MEIVNIWVGFGMMENSEKRREQTGGASFYPRLNPRPKYPPFSEFLKRLVVSYTRAPLLLALVTKIVYPSYLKLLRRLVSKGWSKKLIFTFVTSVLYASMYFGVNGVFFIMDKYKLLQEYKMPRKPYQQPSGELMQATVKDALFSKLIVAPIMLYYSFNLFERFQMLPLEAALPSVWSLYKQFAFANLVNEVGFYWAHRTFHSKLLYKRFHKQHHQYKGTMGIAAEWANPVEALCANLLPTFAGMLFFGRHPLVFWTWLAYRLEETYDAHSGYYFGDTFLAKIGLTHSVNAAFHDAHHTDNRGNFGFWCWDWLFGTMDAYVQMGDTEGYVKRTQVDEHLTGVSRGR